MTMSKRERSIAMITGIVIGALVLYEYVIDPKVTEFTDLGNRISSAEGELGKAQSLFSTSRRATKQLSTMAGSGLRRNDSAAESELLNGARQWAQEAGLSGWGIKRDGRIEREKDFNKITFRANGTGGMGQIGRFLYRLQTSPMPVRVSDMTISSRKDGTDELAITLSISTIYLAPESDRPAGRPGGPTPPSRNAEVEL